ncbi:MAG TPA: hypothetical protein VNK41_11900 [Vicinamibacterales bacterium]|nr:hypothetical protein [Vicinamibacterales bacterium]
MTCFSCGQRKARRACPALGRDICAICCGTKRLVEIRCPDTCTYLQSARQHPAAVVKKQTERDFAALAPTMRELTERQQRIAVLLLGTVAAEAAIEALDRLEDEDVVAAARALAGTLETALRGVIYEHRPSSGPALRLWTAWKGLVGELARGGGPSVERDAAAALRGIERGVPAGTKLLEADRRAYVNLVRRMIRPAPTDPADAAPEPAGSSLILPG